MKISILFFWVVMQNCSEDGGNIFLWNVGIYPQAHAALQPEKPIVTTQKIIINVNLNLQVLYEWTPYKVCN
jgi:hypothetical protein